MMIRAVIFDLDGVLVSTDELHYEAWKRLADAEGIYFDREINHRLRGVDRMSSLGIVLERTARPYTEAEKLELAERKNTDFIAMLDRLTPSDILPGSLELLTQLRERTIQSAVASASRNARRILDCVGLLHKFNVIVDGNDVSRSKPDPQIFLITARRLLVHPEDCLVIEDAVAGVVAAKRAGMKVLGVGESTRSLGLSNWTAGLDRVNLEKLIERDVDHVPYRTRSIESDSVA